MRVIAVITIYYISALSLLFCSVQSVLLGCSATHALARLPPVQTALVRLTALLWFGSTRTLSLRCLCAFLSVLPEIMVSDSCLVADAKEVEEVNNFGIQILFIWYVVYFSAL
jgi:hypothetical protein